MDHERSSNSTDNDNGGNGGDGGDNPLIDTSDNENLITNDLMKSNTNRRRKGLVVFTVIVLLCAFSLIIIMVAK